MATLKLGKIKVTFFFNPETKKMEKIPMRDAMDLYKKGHAIYLFEGKPSDIGQFMEDAKNFSIEFKNE